MANPEHLAILKQGVEVWNQWREENPKIIPDLSHADFHDPDEASPNFQYINLTGANLSFAVLEWVNLNHACLDGANLTSACLDAAFLMDTQLKHTILIETKFEEAELDFADLECTDLSGTFFKYTNLAGVNLKDIQNWKNIKSIYCANIYKIQNAPDGFREWALAQKAIECDNFDDYYGLRMLKMGEEQLS